jgi:hypothetical protein
VLCAYNQSFITMLKCDMNPPPCLLRDSSLAFHLFSLNMHNDACFISPLNHSSNYFHRLTALNNLHFVKLWLSGKRPRCCILAVVQRLDKNCSCHSQGGEYILVYLDCLVWGREWPERWTWWSWLPGNFLTIRFSFCLQKRYLFPLPHNFSLCLRSSTVLPTPLPLLLGL